MKRMLNKERAMKHRTYTAFIIAAAMVLASLPVSGNLIEARAETGGNSSTAGTAESLSASTASVPSVTAYATKAQMMGDTFAPKTDGTADNIGKIILGKRDVGPYTGGSSDIDAHSKELDWYILGKDTGVTGDNTALFAAHNIQDRSKFQSNVTAYPKWQSEADGMYTITMTTGTNVNYSHYGVSVQRILLNKLASNIDYFTEAEQALLNATPVKTRDYKNVTGTAAYSTYTTSDKLYAAQGDVDHKDYRKIWVGSNDSKALDGRTYWNYDQKIDWFWLRSPDYIDFGKEKFALAASPGDYYTVPQVHRIDVDSSNSLLPASNLNLSNVLFASSATAATSDATAQGEIDDGTAMTLRLKGSSAEIGSVVYDTLTKKITAKKGTTSADVALVVQGKNGGKDWYYSKQIEGTDPVKTAVSDIETAVGISGIDLASCRIWIEIPVDGCTLAYVVEAGNLTHKHTYSSTWKSDADNHYKECTEDGCTAQSDSAAHDTNGCVAAAVYKAAAATCTANAKYYKSCSVCGYCAYINTEEGTFYSDEAKDSATGHNYGDENDPASYIQVESGHFRMCKNDGCKSMTKEEVHIYSSDTDEYCDICNYKRSHGHVPTLVDAKEASCTEDGWIQHYKCTECNMLFKDGFGITKLKNGDELVLKHHTPSLVKAVESTCTKEGNPEYYRCDKCDKTFTDRSCSVEKTNIVTAKKKHDLQLVPAVSATCIKDGAKQYYECKECCVMFADSAAATMVSAADILDRKENAEHSYGSDNKCRLCGKVRSGSNGGDSSSSSGGSGSGSSGDSSGGSSSGNTGNGSGSSSGNSSSSGSMSSVNRSSSYSSYSEGSDGTRNGVAYCSGTWVIDAKGWRYRFDNGTYACGNMIKDINGVIREHPVWVNTGKFDYAFGSDGYLRTGWIFDASDEKWYYCDENTGRKYGWLYDYDGGYWYYLDASTGQMLTGWQLINGKSYYLAPMSSSATYTFDASSSKWVYDNIKGLRPYGSLYMNTTTPDNVRVNADGVRKY